MRPFAYVRAQLVDVASKAAIGGAFLNAIYNASGVHVRYMPSTLDKIIAGLPE